MEAQEVEDIKDSNMSKIMQDNLVVSEEALFIKRSKSSTPEELQNKFK